MPLSMSRAFRHRSQTRMQLFSPSVRSDSARIASFSVQPPQTVHGQRGKKVGFDELNLDRQLIGLAFFISILRVSGLAPGKTSFEHQHIPADQLCNLGEERVAAGAVLLDLLPR
jgi:hypothetical protein